jgi:hypothetical protein
MTANVGRLDRSGSAPDVQADPRAVAVGTSRVSGSRVAATGRASSGARKTVTRGGLTLVRLLCAIVAATLVIGSATPYRPGVADGRRQADRRTSPGARALPRGGVTEMDVVSQQPAVIYADARAFSFNTGIGPTAGVSLLASLAPPRDRRTTRSDGGARDLAFAKTVTFFFAADSTNSRVPGAFALWRELNDATPEVLLRNVLPDTVPFFVYRCAVQETAGGDSLAEVPSDRLPITFADTTTAGIDAQSLRVVELHFLVTNGAHGAAQKVERVSIVAMLPGAGHSVQPVDGAPPAPVWLFAAVPRGGRLERPRLATSD